MKYNFYLLIIVLSMVVLSACAPTQREQASHVAHSVADGQVTESIEETPNVVELPTAVPVTYDVDSVARCPLTVDTSLPSEEINAPTFPSEILGTITKIEDRILVEQYPGVTFGDKVFFSFSNNTPVYQWIGNEFHPISTNDLEVGQCVEVWSLGFVLASFPGQAGASLIIVHPQKESDNDVDTLTLPNRKPDIVNGMITDLSFTIRIENESENIYFPDIKTRFLRRLESGFEAVNPEDIKRGQRVDLWAEKIEDNWFTVQVIVIVEETKIPEVVELPTATPVTTEAYISPVDREVMQMANRLNISYDDAKYHYIVNDAIQLSGIHNVLSSRYPDSYAGELVKNIGKNSEFVQLFSKPVDETEMLQEAKNYLKEEFLKHLTIGKVKHSLADLERDSLILEQIIREKILYKPIGRLYFHYAVDAPTNSIQLSVTNFRQFSEILKQTDIVFPESVTISNKDNGYTMLYYNPDSMLPISTPIAPDAYPPPGTPFPTPIPWWENDQLFVEMSERFQIPYDELKYYLLINNRIVYSDLSHAFATQYYGNYAGVSTEYEAFVLLFSKTMNEEELLQEARKYIEEDLIKYIKIRKVDYSLAELKYDEYLLEKIIGTQLMFQPIIEFYAGYGIDAPSNRVMLLVTDIEQFNSMLSQTDIVLPKSVVIVEVEGFVRQPSDTIVLPIPTSIPQTIDG